MITFDIFYSYSQICVFSPLLKEPFNDWLDLHVKQGFVWRPQSVSFRTFVEEGLCKVSVNIANEFLPNSLAKRAFVVPFESNCGEVEIGSITSSQLCDLPSQNYSLYVEFGENSNGELWASITFVPDSIGQAKILICDADLSPLYPLDMNGFPA